MSEPRETTDEEIAAQVQKGIIEQFGILVRRYENKLIRYASKFLFDPMRAYNEYNGEYKKVHSWEEFIDCLH